MGFRLMPKSVKNWEDHIMRELVMCADMVRAGEQVKWRIDRLRKEQSEYEGPWLYSLDKGHRVSAALRLIGWYNLAQAIQEASTGGIPELFLAQSWDAFDASGLSGFEKSLVSLITEILLNAGG